MDDIRGKGVEMIDAFPLRTRPDVPVYRPINNVAILVRIADTYGIDAKTLLAGSQIEDADIDDPHKIITTEQELCVYHRFHQLIPEPWIGLELGNSLGVNSKGKLGIAAMCCANGLDALRLVVSNFDLACSFHQYEVWKEGDMVYASLRELIGHDDISQMLFDIEVASLYSITSLLLEDVSVFKELYIAYPMPAYAERYREMFHCRVTFNAPRHLIIVEAKMLLKAMKLANPLDKKLFAHECAQLCARLSDQTGIADKIRHEITIGQTPYPNLEQLARRINVSPRTIRRRLAADATSYKGILSDMRLKQALHLIRSTDLTIEQIAGKIGYSDTANFCHAFKGWTGCTPGSFRKLR
jgi:AraC-like DNA-binding protein